MGIAAARGRKGEGCPRLACNYGSTYCSDLDSAFGALRVKRTGAGTKKLKACSTTDATIESPGMPPSQAAKPLFADVLTVILLLFPVYR